MASSFPQEPTTLQRMLERELRQGPRTGKQLLEVLQVSQPTLSRTIRSLQVTTYRLPGERTPYYALLRTLPMGLSPRQRIYRILSAGNIQPFGEVEFLLGGGTLERTEEGSTRLYDGLPPYMLFAAPSGFLGREVAQAVSRSRAFPSSLKDWNDDHKVAFLFTHGANLPGNLIFGDTPLQSEMELMCVPPTKGDERLEHYVDMALRLKHSSYGSSAGGEQPKFLWVGQDSGHVIVKFARCGSRMAALLPLEHLALRALAGVGVPTAQTEIISSDEYVFLEIKRFDRIGLKGRVGMLSAGAVDDEFFGQRDTWPEFAARCVAEGYLTKKDAEHVSVMAAFSELIGNTDRHFENISMLIGDDGEYSGIAPAYDILPMRYASIGGGVDPDLVSIEPKVGTIGALPRVWKLAAQAADEFWCAVADADLVAPMPQEIRELAVRNRQVARDFVSPLLPA
ncbi:HipA domain-containing protein [Curvibacter sp. RS43]|uniref:HipA domain-containing protein n=1 Tax=Curvibacter microcysteis TaxID=3026419 RepID=UPI00235F3511|nr:HipA domain-containing protein [Curvibacter sp. RS43]MDD0812685.1 HipA domain-containing protein [Curvibacter sp. RS43]